MNAAQIEEIRKRLDERPRNLRCAYCGEDDWSVALMTYRLDTGEVETEERALAYTCQHCGFVRLHSLRILDDEAPPHE